MSWWACELVDFPHCLVSFHTKKTPSELQVNQHASRITSLLTGRMCLSRSHKSKHRKKEPYSGLVENMDNLLLMSFYLSVWFFRHLRQNKQTALEFALWELRTPPSNGLSSFSGLYLSMITVPTSVQMNHTKGENKAMFKEAKNTLCHNRSWQCWKEYLDPFFEGIFTPVI